MIFGITQLNLFGLKHQKWSGDGSLRKIFEHIWQPENGLVTSSWLFLFLIKSPKKETGFGNKNEVRLLEDFDNLVLNYFISKRVS